MKNSRQKRMSRMAWIGMIGWISLSVLQGGEPVPVQPPRRVDRIRQALPSHGERFEPNREQGRDRARPSRGQWVRRRPPRSSHGRPPLENPLIQQRKKADQMLTNANETLARSVSEEAPTKPPVQKGPQQGKLPSQPKSPPSPHSPLPTGMEAFRAFVEKNIFDPERHPSPPRPPKPEEEKNVGPDYLTICGVLIYKTNCLIFTKSRRPEWQGSYRPGDQIGRFRILSANTRQVFLQLPNGQTVKVPVGQAVIQKQTNDWVVAPPPEHPIQISSTSSANLPYRPSSLRREFPPPVQKSGGEFPKGIPKDILQRLRERRLKELGE